MTRERLRDPVGACVLRQSSAAARPSETRPSLPRRQQMPVGVRNGHGRFTDKGRSHGPERLTNRLEERRNRLIHSLMTLAFEPPPFPFIRLRVVEARVRIRSGCLCGCLIRRALARSSGWLRISQFAGIALLARSRTQRRRSGCSRRSRGG